MNQTLLIPYASSGQENGGVKIEVPAQSVDPGEAVQIYLWGRSEAALTGYTLTQGSDGLGAGAIRQYPGQTEVAYVDLDGTGGLQAFDWPVLSLVSVAAEGNLYVVDGNVVSLAASSDMDMTHFFRLSGNALALAEGAPKYIGPVKATVARSSWCRQWEWTAPATPAIGLPAGTCDTDDEDRDTTLYWFFLLRWGVMQEEFSLALAETYAIEGDIEAALHFDANDIVNFDGALVDTWVDRYGNTLNYCKYKDVIPNGFNDGQVATSSRYYTSLYRFPCVRIRAWNKNTADYKYSNMESVIQCSFESKKTESKTLFFVHSAKDKVTTTDGCQGRLEMNSKTYDASSYPISATTGFGSPNTSVYNARPVGSGMIYSERSITTIQIDNVNGVCSFYKNSAFQFSISSEWKPNPAIFEIGYLLIGAGVSPFAYNAPIGIEQETYIDMFEIILFDCMFPEEKRILMEQDLKKKWGI